MKKYILIFIGFIILISSIVTFLYFSSFREINFNIKQTGLTVNIYKLDKDQKVGTLKNNNGLSLQNGDYYFVATGDKVDLSHNKFKIDDSTKIITVDPDYSTNYLASQLTNNNVIIQTTINAAFPAIIGQYDTFDQALLKKGDWYGGLLKYRSDDSNIMKDSYRVILHKEVSGWVVIKKPEIVVTQSNFPTVPIDVLTAVNNLLDS